MWPGEDAVEGYAYPIPSGDSGNSVEVLNGTSRRGLARAGTATLRRAGFDVVYFGNASEPADSTTVLVRAGSEELGARLLQALGTGRVVGQADSSRRVAATIILGLDYRSASGEDL